MIKIHAGPMTQLARLSLLPLVCCSFAGAAELQTPHLALRHDPSAGSLVLTRRGQETPSLRLQTPAEAVATVAGNTLTLALADGHSLHFTLPPEQPFALVHATLANRTPGQTNIPVSPHPRGHARPGHSLRPDPRSRHRRTHRAGRTPGFLRLPRPRRSRPPAPDWSPAGPPSSAATASSSPAATATR